jgi:hypothetical protein
VNFSDDVPASALDASRQLAGAGCNCRYIRYALIEPVVENKCQKNSDVLRIAAAVPLLFVRVRGACSGASAEAIVAPLPMCLKS